MKRLFDLILCLICIPIFILPLVVLYFVIRFKIGKPVLFTQQRPGKNEEIFRLYKFRTMSNEKDSEGNLLPDEVRLSKLGKFIRSTSLDELPSLLNVLKGEMSFVGPRPLLVQYLPLYSAVQKTRHNVLPGITGWAQVNGRNNLSWQKKFELDIWYVNNHGLLLDVKILFMTIFKVVKRSDISAQDSVTAPIFKGNIDG